MSRAGEAAMVAGTLFRYGTRGRKLRPRADQVHLLDAVMSHAVDLDWPEFDPPWKRLCAYCNRPKSFREMGAGSHECFSCRKKRTGDDI